MATARSHCRPTASINNTHRTRIGFTLIEVLVALLIMSLLAMMGWAGMDSMVRTRDISQAATERSLRLATVIAQWEQDLQALQENPGVPGLAFDGASLRLTRRSERGLQLVVWSLREGQWQRWSAPPATTLGELQEAWLRSQQLQGNEREQLRLLDGITGWQVYFHRQGAWSNAQSSGNVVAPGATGTPGTPGTPGAPGASGAVALPDGVRLVIELPEGKLSRDVLMRAAS